MRGEIKQRLVESRELREILPGCIWKPLAGSEKEAHSYFVCLATLWNSNTLDQINHSPLFQACSYPGHRKTNTSAGNVPRKGKQASRLPLDRSIKCEVWEIGLGPSLCPCPAQSPSVGKGEVFKSGAEPASETGYPTLYPGTQQGHSPDENSKMRGRSKPDLTFPPGEARGGSGKHRRYI